jgi:uncharacterized protein YbjT (DUF2867 family)
MGMNNLITKTSNILAVGAAGKFAGLVLPELAKRGALVRGLIRNPEEGAEVLRHGATEVAIGDLGDIESIAEALKGIESVFYIAPAFMPNEAEVGKRVVEVAKQAGVRRFVFSSVIHPVLSALANHSQKGPVEDSILDSGMEYAFLHPTVFFQNFAGSWPNVVQSGVFAEPWSTLTRFSRVDYRDVAEIAAIALTEDHLNFGTYELCAEGHLNRIEVAKVMSEVLGREIRAERFDPAKAVAGAGDTAEGLTKMFDWYDNHGLQGNALTLRAILGREPRTLRAFIEELALSSRAAVLASA